MQRLFLALVCAAIGSGCMVQDAHDLNVREQCVDAAHEGITRDSNGYPWWKVRAMRCIDPEDPRARLEREAEYRAWLDARSE
jgi:hypothetical protein